MDSPHPLDPFFFVPLDGLRFLGFECVIGIFSSLIIATASFVFLFLNPNCFLCDSHMAKWLWCVAWLRLVDLPIKGVLLCKVYELSKRINHEDRRIMTRRLMELVRSRLFTYQKYLNHTSFIVICYGLVKVAVNSQFSDQHFYQFCISVIMTFALRLIIGYVNYQIEQRKVMNRGQGEYTQFFKHGATLYDIENIRIVEVTSDNGQLFRDLCAICTDEFNVGELVRMLPCNETHTFHKDCIDRWLVQKDACPLCWVSIRKK